MSVLGRLLVASAERIDLPDVLSIDSFVAGDFKYLLKGLVGDGKPLILKGFDVINPGDAIGSQSISVRIADSVVLYPGSNAGPFFHGLQEGHAQAQPVVPELRKNATNFVYLTFSTFETSRDTRAFWDPDLDGGEGGEFTQDINTESVLKVDINVSTASFPENTIPVCKVTVGPAVIESIEDARELMFRLGSGGITPNPFSRYSWRQEPSSTYERNEPPTEMSSALDPNPFQGADKNIRNLKEWMDAIMTKLAELGGTTFWYEDAGSYNLVNLFLDSLGTSYKSKGKWEHSSATPGQITWTEDIVIKTIPDLRDIIVRAGSKTLTDEQVMYIPMVRDADFNTGDVAVDWFNGLNIVNGVVGSFQNLVKGDWVKKKGDHNSNHLRVEEFYANTNLTGGVTTPALARSIKLSGNYLGLTQTERGARTKGVYTNAEVLVSNRNATLEDLGGNLHWLAVRTDTIMNVSNITTTTVVGDISDADGSTAKFTADVAHGLVDGDRFTIAGSTNYDGTYQVEVESATIFYINTTETADEADVTGRYAVVTTTTRSTADGLQLESANHNFADNEKIIVAGTSSSFDGSYLIKVRSATTFSIPMAAFVSSVSTGTATLARVNVRSEFAINELAQGQSIGIGTPDTDNILSYIGMGSLAQTSPTYNVPIAYNTLDGMANYNGVENENLTARVSKLTAMMADKAQDKTIKLLPSGYASVTNTTNGADQEIVFNAGPTPPQKLDIAMPGSDFPNGTIGLTGTLVLAANEAAYVTIDRNTVFSVANLAGVTVAPIVDVPVDENVLILAVRLNTAEVWLWDGFYVSSGAPVPVPGTLETRVNQDRTTKLIAGGTWDWDLGTETLTWDANAFLQIPGLANSVNQIDAGNAVIGTGEVAYVTINRAGPGGSLTVNVAAIASVVLGAETVVIARRDGNDVIVGNHSMRLEDQVSKTLYAGMSDQNLIFIGAVGEGDSAPAYSSENYVTDGDSLTEAVSVLDDNLQQVSDSIRWKEPVADYASLPALNNVDGDVRLTLDTNTPYRWIDATDTWVPLNAAGAGLKLLGGGTLSVDNGGGLVEELIEETSTSTNTGTTISVVSNRAAAIFFTPDDNCDLTHVDISLTRITTPGNAICYLYDVDGSIEPDNLLATSDPVDIATIPTLGPPNVRSIFNFATSPALVAGTQYALVFQVVGGVGAFDIRNDESGAPPLLIKRTDNFGVTPWNTPTKLVDIGIYAEVFDPLGGSVELHFTDDMFLEKAGLQYSDNNIDVSESPIVFANNQQVAWVTPNLVTGGPALTVTVGDLNTVPANGVIIARREVGDVIVGSSSMRLRHGESKKLYAGVSDELLSVIPAAHNADNTGQLRLLENTDSPKRVNVSAVNKVVPDGTEYGIQLSNLMLEFEGAQIDFDTGDIFEADGSTPLGIDFIPATIAAGQYRWYSVTLIPSAVTGTNKISGQLLILAGEADGATADAAPRAPFAGNGIQLGQVVVQESGGSIADIGQADIVQLGTGGSGGGTGDANELLERVKETFADSTFEFVTPVIFSTVEKDLTDEGNSDAVFSFVKKGYEFGAASDKFTSMQMLDPEFLEESRDVSRVDLVAYWNPGEVDPDATYKISRNGGNEYQEIEMERVGDTDTFRGSMDFEDELVDQTLSSNTGGSAASEVINVTTVQALGQIFTLANAVVNKTISVNIVKTGSPLGKAWLEIRSNNAGSPSTEVLAASELIDIASLTGGTNVVTVDMQVALAAGTYHIVLETDATYKTSFSAGVTEIAGETRTGIATTDARTYNGTTWSALTGESMRYTLAGRTLDMRVEITSSAGDVTLMGYGLFYANNGPVVSGVKSFEVVRFSGDANTYEFNLTRFKPNPDTLKVYDVNSGKVYRYGAFTLSGSQVIFQSGQFYSPGESIVLRFEQNESGSYDNSDDNANLLAENKLGSQDPALDRSAAGEGVLLRSSNGTLVEVSVSWNGTSHELVIAEVT